MQVVIGREKFAGGEIAEDIRERPGAEDLAVAPDGQLIRDVGEAAGGDGGWSGGACCGEDGGGLALHGFGCGSFRGCPVAEDDGDEDAERAKQEAENETVPALAGACEGAADECAEDPDEENDDGVHVAVRVRDPGRNANNQPSPRAPESGTASLI